MSAAFFGAWKLTQIMLARVGSQKLINFCGLHASPRKLFNLIKMSQIPIVTAVAAGGRWAAGKTRGVEIERRMSMGG
jgi:hypothetical protein